MCDHRRPLSPLRASGRILSVFVLVGLLAVALDAGIDTGLRRIKTSEFGIWNSIVGGTINAEILITGSSRALTHYDARILQERLGRSAYNIGLNGSQTDMQVARLEDLPGVQPQAPVADPQPGPVQLSDHPWRGV